MAFVTESRLCTRPEETTCEKNYPNVCYPHRLRCVYEAAGNFQLGCRNAGHLRRCAFHDCPNHFKCPDAYCIPIHVVCNGRRDCPNGEDEKGCRPLSCPGFLKCRTDGIYVHPHDLRVTHLICHASKDDKSLKGVNACPNRCQYSGNAVLCGNIQPRSPLAIRKLARNLIYRNVICKMESNCWEPLASTQFLINLEMSRCALVSTDLMHLMGLVYLKFLKITHNKIKTIGKQVFRNLKNIEEIDVRYNSLSMFGDVDFADANIVRSLRLDHNRIHTITMQTFARLQQLEILTMSYNHIASIDQNMQLRNPILLKEVNISHNPIILIEHKILLELFQDLSRFDSSPMRLCCLLKSIEKCYPKFPVTGLCVFDCCHLGYIGCFSGF